jgi:phosphoserine phosphatase RsbU/P
LPFPELRDPRLRYPLAALSLGGWLLASASALSGAYEGPMVLLPWVSGICLAVFFLAGLLLTLGNPPRRSEGDPELLLRDRLVGGLVTLSLVLASQLFAAGSDEPLAYFMSEVYPVLAALPVVIYLTRTFASLQHLVNEQTATTRITLRWFVGLLALTALAALAPLPLWALYAVYALAALPLFSLLFRVRWIAGMAAGSRIYMAVYLFLLTWVHLGLIVWFVVADSPGLFFSDVRQNPFALLLMTFNGGYAFTALLAVLFNWPLSAVIEQRNSDIDGFQSLNELINKKDSAEDIQELLLELCFRHSGAQAAWFTRPAEGGTQVQYLRRGHVSLQQISHLEAFLHSEASDTLQERDLHLYLPDAGEREELRERVRPYRSVLTFPMSVNGMPEGNLVLLREHKNAFTPYSIRMLGTYVNQARLALEKNRLVVQAVENERMRNEFEIATRVQEALLPERAPERAWVTIAAEYKPAQEVGGDCYDFFECGEDLHVVMGDVTGKGMGAAFNVAELKGIFHSHTEYLSQPAEFLVRVNRAVSACFSPGVFLTLIYLGFRPRDNEFIYARAGHCQLLFYRAADASTTYLEDRGMGLGIVRNDSYRDHIQVCVRRFDTNDILVLYSDGIMEAQHPDTGEEYGLERLRQVVARHAFFTAEEIKSRILSDVLQFCAGGKAADDITLLVIKFQ